jgi:hypothetical protein
VIAPPFARSREIAPAIVAESLTVAEALPVAAQTLMPASAPAVAASLARLVAPPTARDIPPAWLRPEQVTAWRRVVSAVRSCRGALLAEPPGTGKTWIALAAALALTRRPVACLVPAAVAPQWERVAARIGVAIELGTHERASRGGLPPLHDLAIIDESHHYRNTGIRRYAHVARWLAGRSAILLSATPVINRLDDLLNQLALAIRDDALAIHGVPSLRTLGTRDALPESVTRVVIRSPASVAVPGQVASVMHYELPSTVLHAIDIVRRLKVSRDRGVRALVQGVLLRAAGSSPAALAGALRRYRLLLANHGDALAVGRALSRAELRKWAGGDGEQTVLWSLLDGADADADLDLADEAAVTEALGRLATATPVDDPKLQRCRAVTADRRTTLIFTGARETVGWLRRGLGHHRTAWCTGASAGIGTTPAARLEVLRLYGPAGVTLPAPPILICTDVAAEGLDLQRAERVVHYDLPWTPARLEQRTGRAARIGAAASTVEVVRFDPPPGLEAAIHPVAILRRKSRLPRRAQLTNAELDAWNNELAGAATLAGVEHGIAACHHGSQPGILAGLEVTGLDDRGQLQHGGRLVWIEAGHVSDSVADVRRALAASACAQPSDLPGLADCRAAWTAVDPVMRRLLTELNGQLWTTARRAEHAALVERLASMRRRAVTARDGAMLGLIANALRLIASGRTAGETLLLRDLAGVSGRAALRALARLPAARSVLRYEVRVAGMVITAGKTDSWTAGQSC